MKSRVALGRLAAIAALVAVGLPLMLPAAVSIAIVPPYVEKVVRPGTRVSDTLSFTNRGTEPVRVSVDLADFAVAESGEVSEAPPGTDPTSLAPFVRVSPSSVLVVAGQQVFFRYALDVPADFRQLRAMIYFSSRPEVPQRTNQVVIVPRLGIPIYVENMAAAPASLRVREVSWERSGAKGDLLKLALLVGNEGERNIRPAGYVQVRSIQGGFEKAFDFNQGHEPVLPGQRRRWELTFGPVPGGELSVRLHFAISPRSAFDSEYRVSAAPG